MISIGIVDKNQIYSLALKTLLEQEEDFTVHLLSPEYYLNALNSNPDRITIFIVDDDFIQSVKSLKLKPEPWPLYQCTIPLIMEADDFEVFDSCRPAIHMGSSKQVFTASIRAAALHQPSSLYENQPKDCD